MDAIPLDNLACRLNTEFILNCGSFVSINSQMSPKIISCSCSWVVGRMLPPSGHCGRLIDIPIVPKGCILFLSWEFELFSDVSCRIFWGEGGPCYFFQTGVRIIYF